MAEPLELSAADEAPDMFLDVCCSTCLSEVFSPPVCCTFFVCVCDVCVCEGYSLDLIVCIRHIPIPHSNTTFKYHIPIPHSNTTFQYHT